MTLLHNIASGLRTLFRKQQSEQEMDEELRAYVDTAADEKCKEGLNPTLALRAARLQAGSLEHAKESVRAAGWESVIESFWQDLRFGARMLRKDLGFTTVAVLTLALGIGANTVIFSVVDRILLNLFPFPNPDRLVAIYQNDPGIPKAMISYPNFLDFQKDNHAFEAMALWRNARFTLLSDTSAQRLNGRMVSSNYFSVLGVPPILGRTFSPDEDQLGARPVALIGEAFWKTQFGANPRVEGTTLRLDGKLYSIIGVMPSFRVLKDAGGADGFFDDIYVPIGQWDAKVFRNRSSGPGTVGYGRLRVGVTLSQARADVDHISNDLQAAYPTSNSGVSIAIFPLKENTIGEIQPVLWMLFAAVGFVLLIACTNIANLLLTRAAIREREFAMRAALGASRARIIRQYLTEGIVLSWSGGIVAIVVAAFGTQFLMRLLPSTLPGASLVALNFKVLLFALGLSTFTGILFTLVPAFRISGANPRETLQESGRTVAGLRHRVRGFLIVAEMALALVLLVGAGLMVRSMARLWQVNPGFDQHNVLTFSVAAPPGVAPTPAENVARLRELVGRIGSVSGIESVSLSVAAFPFGAGSTTVCWPADRPKPKNPTEAYPMVSFVVGPDYFTAMRIRLLKGRLFTAQDDGSSPAVAVVDDDLAKTVFGNQNPVGKRILVDLDENAEIVGVVDHVKTGGLDDKGFIQIRSQLYQPYEQVPADRLPVLGRDVGAVVRSSLPPQVLLPSIRKVVNEMDSNYVVHDPRTMESLVQASLADRSFFMSLLVAFAGTALVLAVIGIYGVVSYAVTERTKEIGIRMALGARPAGILRMLIGGGARLGVIGVAVGIATALILTRFLSSLLFGVTATDMFTYAATALALFGVALAACYIPARRATKVDPIVALRYE